MTEFTQIEIPLENKIRLSEPVLNVENMFSIFDLIKCLIYETFDK